MPNFIGETLYARGFWWVYTALGTILIGVRGVCHHCLLYIVDGGIIAWSVYIVMGSPDSAPFRFLKIYSEAKTLLGSEKSGSISVTR